MLALALSLVLDSLSVWALPAEPLPALPDADAETTSTLADDTGGSAGRASDAAWSRALAWRRACQAAAMALGLLAQRDRLASSSSASTSAGAEAKLRIFV
jgi:hypothetical protein